MKPIAPFGLPIGISITIWAIIGTLRWLSELWPKKKRKKLPSSKKIDIAAIIPAHNEELIIRKCVQALKGSLEPHQIYVISDGSRDKTYRRARMEGCHVSRLKPSRGKAKAMIYLIKRFRLYERYKFIFIVDADTNVDKNLVKRALKILKHPEVGVVFASSQIKWQQHLIPNLKYYFLAYRDRLNRLLQYFYIYGQTWKYTNVNYVIPGFCTIYRSRILKQLEIDTPGLLIEDFNLAFQFHKKKLGKLGFNHTLIGWDQYPDNLVDYWKQIRRWNIGFFQTVKKNGIWPSFFWLSLGIFSLEVLLHSIFIIFMPFLIFFLIAPSLPLPSEVITVSTQFHKQFGPYQFLNLRDILLGAFVIDYLFTVVIGILKRRPQFLFYGLFFFFLHYVTSLVMITSLFPGFFSKSSGRWSSPKRRS